MQLRHFAVVVIVGLSGAAQAALFDRGGVMIYDDVLDITWLQDANMAGSMNHEESVAWADALIIGGFSDWRLASMNVNRDNGSPVDCSSATELACRDNELGYMFYYNLMGNIGDNLTGNQGLFANIQNIHAGLPDDNFFFFVDGTQITLSSISGGAWAVRSGDVTFVGYSQNFESLDLSDPNALSNDGWLIYGNVFDGSSGAYLYGYGAFSAPNFAANDWLPGFSALVINEGGPDQGAQQLSVFNDYHNREAHSAGDIVEANVYQERPILAGHVGEVWSFSFDAKLSDQWGVSGDSTAAAFIKLVDPNNGFALTQFLTLDMTTTSGLWTSYQMSLSINAGMLGQFLQFGFLNTATHSQPSSVIYDNISFGLQMDSDDDGIDDIIDNCTNVANANQLDTNGDGHGNICDADLNGDCIANAIDLGLFKLVFFTGDDDADFNGDGVVNAVDLGIFKLNFFTPPGPSAVTCAP